MHTYYDMNTHHVNLCACKKSFRYSDVIRAIMNYAPRLEYERRAYCSHV